MHLCSEMHATAKKASLAKIRRRVGENSNEMLKRRPVASIIGEKVKLDKKQKWQIWRKRRVWRENLPEGWRKFSC